MKESPLSSRTVRFDESVDEGVSDGKAYRSKPRVSVAEKRQAKTKVRQEAAVHARLGERAKRAYEAFHRLPDGLSTLAHLERSSAGVAGWLDFADFLDKAAAQDRHLERLLDCTGVRQEMEQQAACQASIPQPKANFGVLATTVALCETEEPLSELNVNEAWTDVEFEVALDSGSQDHVCDEADTPGYVLTSMSWERPRSALCGWQWWPNREPWAEGVLSLIHISEPTRPY